MASRRKVPTNSDATQSPSAPTNGDINNDSKPATSASSSYDNNSTTNTTANPFLPTATEALLLSVYPSTLLLGSLFSLLSPTSRSSPYNPISQSHDPLTAPSYFATKSNIFNQYFVKVGWFWISLALLIFLLTSPFHGPPLRPVLTPRRLKTVARWGVATLWWVAVTQWFFGPAIVDRGFTLTGGQCDVLALQEAKGELSGTERVLSHAACKVVGGEWRGGHDISGHVFILILGSAMLWAETLPVLLRGVGGLTAERRVRMSDGKVVSASVESEGGEGREPRSVEEKRAVGFGMKFVIGVAGLSWWMLLMTAAYFHTWFEKFTGFLVAFAALWVVYFLPRGVAAVRAVVGMPGV